MEIPETKQLVPKGFELTTPENTITYHNIVLFVGHTKILYKHCFQFLLGAILTPKRN